MDQSGKRFSGEAIYQSICMMIERGNGLGSGYAAYGIYPDFPDKWCFHVMYDTEVARDNTEEYLQRYFSIIHSEPIPTDSSSPLRSKPLLWRYFMDVKMEYAGQLEEALPLSDFVIERVMYINKTMDDAFVFSSGKNMGIFKGVGDPDAIGDFYKIGDYKGYLWTAHNRFPTNSVGWWGGAHPFGLLDWSIVHNGEISSYGINRRYLENFGYYCTLFTDTEVMTYLFDLLVRRHGLDFTLAAKVLASPFWSQIERMEDEETRLFLSALRTVYAPALVNGPFAVIVANANTMVGLNDRIKLRPLVTATKGATLYIASEESAIVKVCREPDSIWMPEAGEPTIGVLQNKHQMRE
jgi:glutamate synthase domain-containing protein 1